MNKKQWLNLECANVPCGMNWIGFGHPKGTEFEVDPICLSDGREPNQLYVTKDTTTLRRNYIQNLLLLAR